MNNVLKNSKFNSVVNIKGRTILVLRRDAKFLRGKNCCEICAIKNNCHDECKPDYDREKRISKRDFWWVCFISHKRSIKDFLFNFEKCL